MRLFLKLLFAAIFVCIVAVNIQAAMTISLLKDLDRFASDPWAIATLWDAYCGFITFFCWVCFRERSWTPRVIWFVLIMTLGNIAMSAYVLIQLFRWKDGEPIDALFRRPAVA